MNNKNVSLFETLRLPSNKLQSTMLTSLQPVTKENAEQILGVSLVVAETLEGAVSVVNGNSAEETEKLLGAVTTVLTSIVK